MNEYVLGVMIWSHYMKLNDEIQPASLDKPWGIEGKCSGLDDGRNVKNLL